MAIHRNNDEERDARVNALVERLRHGGNRKFRRTAKAGLKASKPPKRSRRKR